jgi:polyisoprenoid-binding protein YceI
MTNTTTQTVTPWSLDTAHSQVGFGVRHMMISTVRGKFTAFEGTIHLDEDALENSSVEIEIDAASVDTANQDRDNHLRSGDFFDVESFPTLRFESRKVEQADGGLRVTGDLTIKDVTREVTLEAEELGRGTDPWGNPRVAFRAETTINRKDFGLTWNQTLEAGGVLVGTDVKISLDVQAIPAGDDADEG